MNRRDGCTARWHLGPWFRAQLQKFDFDVRIAVVLSNRDLLLPGEFEEREEESNHLASRPSRKNLPHGHSTTLGMRESIHEISLMQTDGSVVVLDAVVAEPRDVDGLHDALKRLD